MKNKKRMKIIYKSKLLVFLKGLMIGMSMRKKRGKYIERDACVTLLTFFTKEKFKVKKTLGQGEMK